MDERTDLLLRLGFSLKELGMQMKHRQDRVTQLLSQGHTCESPEIIRLVKEYQLLKGQFASLEAQFKEVKNQIGTENGTSSPQPCTQTSETEP